jgi:uncharacterized membrane protein YphA (DoxX/SURF4 family)
MNPIAYDLGQMALRLGVAWVFLYAAWRNTNTAAARSWTRGETSLLFRPWGLAPDHWLVGFSTFVGMVMMYGGGLAVLIGCAPRPGGLALAIFSLMGVKIHAIRRDEAEVEANAGVTIAWSAFGAHIAAGLKNWALIGAGLYFALVGTGRWSLGPDWGAGIVDRLLGSA